MLRHRFRSLFYSQKQSPGTVKKPCGSNLGSIVGTLFGSSNNPLMGTVIGTLLQPPIESPCMASKRRNIRASSPCEVVPERGNHSLEQMQEQGLEQKREQRWEPRRESRCSHEDSQIGNRVGVGGRRGKGEGNEDGSERIPGWKMSEPVKFRAVEKHPK